MSDVLRTTQLAKLSFNHSIGRTYSCRFSTLYKIKEEKVKAQKVRIEQLTGPIESSALHKYL